MVSRMMQLGGLGRDLFDVHAAFGRSHHHVAGLGAVEENREVELPGDVDPLLDVDPVYLLASGSGLDGHQGRTEHLLGQFTHRLFGGRRSALDACGDDRYPAKVGMFLEGPFASTTGVYL